LGLDDERAKEMPFIASMGIYVISKNAMLDLLREKFPGANDFGSEVIPGATSIGMRVCAPFGCLTLRTLFRLLLRDVIPKNIAIQGKCMSYYSFVLRVFNV
jgi:hypothetical protein